MCRKKTDAPVSVNVPVITNSYLLIADTQQVTEAFRGYYIGLPYGYFSTSTKYPLLVFLHGLGQRGDGKEQLQYLLTDGIGKVIKDNRMPVSFTVNGKSFSFIVVSPQYDQQPGVEEVIQLIDTIAAKYRITSTRVYISGLSLGARIATSVAAQFPRTFAAMVPIAGVATNEGMKERCKSIAEANLPVWELHNADDPMADVEDARRFINYLSDYSPVVPPRFTIFDKYGHDAWTTALDTAYREEGRNIYEWMLQYSR
ncbi:MAG TPA: PHB depolymerase family esterase [Flavitalea sp.]|nr:PHB depolymerase family esterase [Flavitalea sp.]